MCPGDVAGRQRGAFPQKSSPPALGTLACHIPSLCSCCKQEGQDNQELRRSCYFLSITHSAVMVQHVTVCICLLVNVA